MSHKLWTVFELVRFEYSLFLLILYAWRSSSIMHDIPCLLLHLGGISTEVLKAVRMWCHEWYSTIPVENQHTGTKCVGKDTIPYHVLVPSTIPVFKKLVLPPVPFLKPWYSHHGTIRFLIVSVNLIFKVKVRYSSNFLLSCYQTIWFCIKYGMLGITSAFKKLFWKTSFI